jgi:hypothetical protein
MEKISMVRSFMIGMMSFAVTAVIIAGSMQGSAVIG